MLDFTWATPWLILGFVAGLAAYWFLRKFIGEDGSNYAAEISAARSALAAAERKAAEAMQSYNLMQSEKARITAELNQVSPKATLVPQLQARVNELTQAHSASKSAADLARSQVTSLQKELEAQANTVREYDGEYRKLHAAYESAQAERKRDAETIAQLTSAGTALAEATHEAARLKSELAAAENVILTYRKDHESLGKSEQHLRTYIAQLENQLRNAQANDKTVEVNGLKTEVLRLTSALAAAQKADLSGEVDRLRAEVTRLTSALAAAPKADLTSEVNTLKAEVVRLTSALAAASKADQSGEVNSLKAEVARLTNALATQPKQDYMELSVTKAEVARLTAALAEARALGGASADVTRLKSELTATNAALDAARSAERSVAMELHAAKNDLSQLRGALEETSRTLAERHTEITGLKAQLASLPADVETFRRYKDALDAANKLVNGKA